MKVATNQIAGAVALLVGLLWLVFSVFLNPKTWINRASNQINGDQQQGQSQSGVGTQPFSPNSGDAPLANENQAQVDNQSPDQGQEKIILDEAGRRVPQSNQTLTPGQEASPAPTPQPTPQPTFEATPQPTPQPTIVPEPVRAGW